MTQYSCTNFISIHLRYFCAKILFKPKTQATRLSCLIFKSCWKTLTNSNESVAHSLRIINQLCACLVRWNRSFSSASGGNRSKPWSIAIKIVRFRMQFAEAKGRKLLTLRTIQWNGMITYSFYCIQLLQNY